MIRMKVVKWVAAGAIALGAVPAIALAAHAKHVTAAASPVKLVSAIQPAKSTRTATKKLTSSTVKKATHSTRQTKARRSKARKHVTHRSTTHRSTTRHTTKKSTSKKTH
jgi:hypothetical protein